MVIKLRTKKKFACAFALVIVGILMSIYADDGRGETPVPGISAGNPWAAGNADR